MKGGERLELARRYVEKWQPRMNLSNWKVYVSETDEDDEGEVARISVISREYVATIMLPSDFARRRTDYAHPGETEEQTVERSVVHELAHLVENRDWSSLYSEIDRAEETIGIPSSLRRASAEIHENMAHYLERTLIQADRDGTSW